MSLVQNTIFCTKTKLCLLIVVVILLTIILAVSLRTEDEVAEESMKFASEKLYFPKCYCVIRTSEFLYKETISFTTGKEEIGHVETCISCESSWTIYLLNKEYEIAVVVERQSWPWADMYNVKEQWKINATNYKIEYSWSGLEINKEIYVIKNSNDVEVARTEHFPLEFGKILKLKDPKSNSTLGIVKRPAFDLFLTWKISVNKTDALPTYLYGVLATITTLKEVDNDDDE